MSAPVTGTYHPPASSQATPARMEPAGDGESVRIVGNDGAVLAALRRREGVLSSHVAGVPRRFELPGGAVFVTTDSDGLERLVAVRNRWGALPDLARIERPGLLLLALGAATVVCVVALMRFGVPLLAAQLAALTPVEISRASGSTTLAGLDRTLLGKTELTQRRRAEIRSDFDTLVSVAGIEGAPALHFRRGGLFGPNAFALMGGQIVMLDELVDAIEDREEIAAILAHELAHARDRHPEQRLWSVAGLGLMAMLVFGDAETLVEEIVTLSSGILELSYSREHEAAADRIAVDMMLAAGMDPSALASGLNKLKALCGPGCKGGGWLSTHPGMDERVQAICAAIPRGQPVRAVCR